MENNKTHKFFERYLNNDLDLLNNYLNSKKEDIKNQYLPTINLFKAPKSYFAEHNPQKVDSMFNVFQFYNAEIYNLYLSLRDMTKEACEYYGINFEEQKYMIHGWFNSEHGQKEIDLTNVDLYHDHSGGHGAPFFHGYYCVNAEPSTTHYLVNREVPFDNININNRAIISETGHPHKIGVWDRDDLRVTIAYDISPLERVANAGYPEQRWIPLG